MITVQVKRNDDHKISEVIVEGHAGYAEYGYDLVCAAVSAITFGTANAIEALLHIQSVKSVGESGFLHFVLPSIADPDTDARVQLLMEAMLISLDTVANSYTEDIGKVTDYIQIIDHR